MIDSNRLRELLSYNQATGVFNWNSRKGGVRVGDVAGCKTPLGYILIGLDGSLYLAHRLAWMYVHGEFPTAWIDHKDRNKSNNRIDNLRPATCPENMANTGVRSTNQSGFKGVSWDKKNKKWRATITVKARQISLGRYELLEHAALAYQIESKRLHPEFSDKVEAFACTDLGVCFVDLLPA